MNQRYLIVVAGWLFSLVSMKSSQASPFPPVPILEFYNCSNSPISLCVADPGVRLPDNNQFNLGENDPNTSSCSVHMTQEVQVHATCSHSFQYKIEVSYFDTSAFVEILSWTDGSTDDQDEAILTFNTEEATNVNVSTNGLPYTSGCFRYHRLRWTVLDECGDMAFCDKRVELYDCQGPIPLNNQGMNILNFHSLYQVEAHLDDIAGLFLDDCTSSGQFLFSVQNSTYKNDTVFQYCEVPVGVLVLFPIWVADAGRDLNCNGSISWEERNKYSVTIPIVFTADGSQDCSDPNLFISGMIKRGPGTGIAKTHVNVTDTNQSYPEQITNEFGLYAFPHTNYVYPVTVTPMRNDAVKNGISTLDLVLIQKHLLSIERFHQPDQLIAADANNSKNVSALDLVVLRKLILGLIDTLPGNRSWAFYPEGYVFPDTLDPWMNPDTTQANTFSDHIIIASENKTSNVNFTGVKIGDVNYSAMLNGETLVTREAYPQVALSFLPLKYEPDEVITIDFTMKDLQSLHGFQFTLSSSDLQFLGASSNLIDLLADDYALFGDQMTMSWFTMEELACYPGDIVFTIKARTNRVGNLQQSLHLTSDITSAELYSTHDQVFTPILISQSRPEKQLTVFGPEPNPWSSTCIIPFYNPNSGNILLSIHDLAGRLVFTRENYFPKGYNSFNLNSGEIQSSGLLYFSLVGGDTSTGSARRNSSQRPVVGKMVFEKNK